MDRRKLVAKTEDGLPETEATGREVIFPGSRSVPDWSEETLARFAELTPLERAWVEWYVCCNNSIQAYRMATGRQDDEKVHRNNGSQIKLRARVRQAVAAALKDRSAAPLMDRGYKLEVLQEQIEIARNSDNPKVRATLPRLIEVAAKLQGEIVQRMEQDVTVRTEADSPALKRFMNAVRMAEQRTGAASPERN